MKNEPIVKPVLGSKAQSNTLGNLPSIKHARLNLAIRRVHIKTKKAFRLSKKTNCVVQARDTGYLQL
jgi:hypothetical protein